MIYVKLLVLSLCYLILSFKVIFLLVNRLKTMIRDSIGSKLLKYFKFLRSSKIGDFDNIGDFNKSWKNLIFLEILRKTRFFRQNWGFRTYVNFSLSAKFNRFFIILGGLEEMDRESWFFKEPEKNVVFRGFPCFHVVLKTWFS